MTKRRTGLFETYRLLNEDPLTLFRQIGWPREPTLQRILFRRYATVSEPDHIKHVLATNSGNYRKTPITRALLEPILGRGLLTSEGDLWRRQRRFAAPAFHQTRIHGFADIMVAATLEMLESWTETAQRGQTVNVLSEMSRLTMKIITKSMFSSGLSEEETRTVSGAIETLSGFGVRLRDWVGLPEWLPRIHSRSMRRSIRAVDRVVNRLIAERRADERDHGDLLSMLMLARDEETGEAMNDRQLRDEVMTVFVAGHETTATALAWIFFALDRYPNVERRLHEELTGIPGSRPPRLADLVHIPYARMVTEEAMRLFPVVPQIARQAIGEDRIGGVRVPAGAGIIINVWLTHRHPGLWEDPERFDPERFDPERSADRPKYAYIPFSGGPRVCIGNAFAMLEAQLILATIARDFRLRLPDGHSVQPVGVPVLHPKGGLPMILEARNRAC